MWPGFSRSTLLSTITTGQPSAKIAAGDVAVAGADPLARVDDEQDDVEVVGDRLLDAALHPLGQRVDRPLPARQVDEHELRRRSLVQTPRMRWRVVCGTGETIATFSPVERVHERRLADVRPPGERRRSPTSFRQVPGVGQQLGRRARSRISPSPPR